MKKDSKNAPFVNNDNTKGRPSDDRYGSVIAQISKDGVCPFCEEQLKKYHKNPIIKEGPHWLATNNMYPYKGAREHVLFIHKKHISDISEMSPEAWSEFQDILTFIIKERDIEGGSFWVRFGDTRYTGASVTHLHAHLISSKPFDPDYAPLMARVG